MSSESVCVTQCVAVCCSVLQCVVVCCSVLQCVAVHCGVSIFRAISAECPPSKSKVSQQPRKRSKFRNSTHVCQQPTKRHVSNIQRDLYSHTKEMFVYSYTKETCVKRMCEYTQDPKRMRVSGLTRKLYLRLK